MDPRFQSSFIPKKPIVAQPGISSSASSVNLFALIAIVVFVLALVLSGGAFFYKGFLVKQIEERKSSFDRAKEAFDPSFIQQVTRLDSRIETSKKLFSSHIAVTPFFDFLSKITLRSVRFRDFSFTYLSPEKISVEMKGQAQNYASVALQSDILNSQKYLHDTIVGDMSLEPAGTVSFSVSTTVDAALLAYATGVTKQGSAAATASTTMATSTSSR